MTVGLAVTCAHAASAASKQELEPFRQQLRKVLGMEAAAKEEDLILDLTLSELRSMLLELGLEEKPLGKSAGLTLPRVLTRSPFMAAVASMEDLAGAKQPMAAAEIRCGPGEFVNVCAWCGESRVLPFDLRTDFVCQDAGLSCSQARQNAPQDGGERLADEQGEQPELCENACAWCGETRYLPFELGSEFVCRDVGLECDENSAHRAGSNYSNCCGFCGAERALPFDFGEEFVCELAGFDCDYSSEEAQRRAFASIAEECDGEMFVNVCAECGAERELPFDLRANFICADAGLECSGELHANVCEQCGETRMCPFSLPDGFVCGSCSGEAPKRYEELELPEAPSEEEPDDGLTSEQREAMRRENERTQLLWKTLIQGLSLVQAAELFESQGHEAPTDEELHSLRTNTLAHFRQKTMGVRRMQKSALKNKNKGRTQRYLNNELVTVAKKDKYVRSGGESLEDKAKTSVELYILGIGRGGRHAVKIARDEKKKGPMSNKHNK